MNHQDIKLTVETHRRRATRAAEADLKAHRREFFVSPPVWLADRLKESLCDSRDLPIAFLLLNISVTVIPACVLLFIWPSHWLGALYLTTNYVFFLQRYLVALLHVTEHKRLFKKGSRSLNALVPYVLAALYGLPCGTYKLHHTVMHHVEGNHAPQDASSTEHFQRDSLPHFLWYWSHHAFGAWLFVPYYAWCKGRLDLLSECLLGEVLYFVGVRSLWLYSPVATFWAVVLPYFVTSLAIMFGNWSQHIFVDPQQHRSIYRLAYNCVGCSDNMVTCNDGYHILHHLNSQIHWTELPQRFLDTIDRHADEEGLSFVGIGFFDVGLAVMMGRLEYLAGKLLLYSPELARMSKTDLVLLLKSRLQAIAKPGGF